MDLDRLKEIWADYVYEGRMSPEVREPVADSWRKCRAANVNPAGGMGKHIDERVLKSVCAANRDLIEIARPVMESVYEIVKKTHYLLVLTDSNGYILETLGDEDIIKRSTDMRFVKGAFWGNLDVGTNAISLALDYDAPIQTIGPEHYCQSHHDWTCSAAPIHGCFGELVGCINLSGDVSTVNEHTLGLILASAYSIEAQIKLRHNVYLMSAALESTTDGIVLLDNSLSVFWMNSAARMMMSAELQQLKKRDFTKLIPNVDWRGEVLRGEKFYCEDARVITNNGIRRYGLIVSQLDYYGSRTLCVTLRQNKRTASLQTQSVSRRDLSEENEEERTALIEALNSCSGNAERAASALGISRATFYRRIKKYGLSTKGAE